MLCFSLLPIPRHLPLPPFSLTGTLQFSPKNFVGFFRFRILQFLLHRELYDVVEVVMGLGGKPLARFPCIWGLCFIGLSLHPLGSPACYFTGFWIVLLFFPARFLDYNLCYFRMMFVSFVFYMWERILPGLSWNVKASCLWCLKSISALIISLVELVHVTWLVLISILRRLFLWQMKSPKHVIRISNWHMIILQSAICNLV